LSRRVDAAQLVAAANGESRVFYPRFASCPPRIGFRSTVRALAPRPGRELRQRISLLPEAA